jgi:hypothetical protein
MILCRENLTLSMSQENLDEKSDEKIIDFGVLFSTRLFNKEKVYVLN